MPTLKISIPLGAKPQGSKNAFHNPRTGRIVMVESSKNLKPLRQQVTNLLAQTAAAQNWTPPNKDTPVTISTNFYYKPGKTVTRKHHTTKPDGDKLQRFCWDAITDSKIWQDDSQATNWTGSKQYGPEDRIDIVISY